MRSLIQITFLLLFCAVVTIVLLSSLNIVRAGEIDFIQYWSGARLFLEGGNPYDPLIMELLQRKTVPDGVVVYMWNPPFVLPFMIFFAQFDFPLASALWGAFQFGVLIFCSWIIMSRLNPSSTTRVKIWYCIAALYPFFEAFYYGQISALLLLGTAVFFYWREDKPFWAGAALSLLSIKPHLLAFTILLVAIDQIRDKKTKLLLGLLSGVGFLSVIATIVQPEIWGMYLTRISSPPTHWFTASASAWMQFYFGIPELRFILSGLAFVTVLLIAPKKSLSNNWLYLSVPISLMITPFTWIFDWVVLLPTMIYVIASSKHAWLAFLTLNLILFIFPKTGQQFYWWYPWIFCIIAAGFSLPRNPKIQRKV